MEILFDDQSHVQDDAILVLKVEWWTKAKS